MADAQETEVGCELGFDVTDAVLALQVAPATGAGAVHDERLVVEVDGGPDAQVTELPTDHGGRLHVVRASTGTLRVSYSATVVAPATQPIELDGADPLDHLDLEGLAMLRQSRYCPSGALGGFAIQELEALVGRPELAREVAAWVFGRLAYEAVSGPLDTAVDTLLASAGTCRDFAHLTISLCRALGVPARLAAVYAPGITPMDFHAVAEVARADGWEVLDATRLAPRQALVRIATGRDAADTAFATTFRGDATLLSSEVVAVAVGDLPVDDHRSAIRLR